MHLSAFALPQAIFGTPAKTKKSPKEVSDSLEGQMMAMEDPLANLPLTSRRGHDVTEENWEERSKRLAELKRRNEEVELMAKMRLGMLSKREQQLLGPTLLAEVEANVVAQQEAAAMQSQHGGSA